MNTSPATTFDPPPRATYLPQMDRLGLLHRGISAALTCLLMLYLSVYVSQIDPKLSLLTCAVCIMLGGKRLLTPAVWPLVAIVGYDALLSIIMPASKPEIGQVLAHPLFLLNCLLLTAVALGGRSVGQQYFLLLGMLVICLVGAVGDFTGHDMTALLPFKLPDDDPLMNILLTQGGDVLRIRGFFSEAGVLAAVSIGVMATVALGATVLLLNRSHTRLAWFGLICAVSMGAAILCITVTKSGFVMILAGALGFAAVLSASRNVQCRTFAVVVLGVVVIGGAGFLFLGPPTLTTYLRGEIAADLNPRDLTPGEMSDHSGVITRYKCWMLAFTSLQLRPFGVGAYGMGTVIQMTGDAGFSHEMKYYFNRDCFGLKNGLADLMVETGVTGLGLLFLWVWVALIRPLRSHLADGSFRSTLIAGVYGAAAVSTFAFLFSCELYPSVAFLLMLKCHADAVAHACMNDAESRTQSVELIG
jgi:hypothetical protein